MPTLRPHQQDVYDEMLKYWNQPASKHSKTIVIDSLSHISKDIVIMDDIEPMPPVKTALEDRKMLGWDIPRYKAMAEALNNNCFINRDGQAVKIDKAKMKRLRNYRHTIRKNPLLMRSPIHQEIIRRLNIQIAKREKRPLL